MNPPHAEAPHDAHFKSGVFGGDRRLKQVMSRSTRVVELRGGAASAAPPHLRNPAFKVDVLGESPSPFAYRVCPIYVFR